MEFSKKNKSLSFCGIMTAISAILSLLINIIPFNTIFLLILMSFVICVTTQRVGPAYAFCTAVATSIVMFFATGQYVYVAEYILLFGTYPVVKFIIESKIKRVGMDKIIKTVYFVSISALFMLTVIYFSGGTAFWGEWFAKSAAIPYILVIVIAAFAWLYDFILTQIIYIYNKKFGGRF